MQRLLFIVNGLGLGNATRCHAVIDHLIQRGYTVDVLTSGNGRDYFAAVEEIGQLLSFESLRYGERKGRVSVTATLMLAPVLIRTLFANARLTRRLIRSGGYVGAVIDSDYTMIVANQRDIPVFAINNADVVVHECRRREIPRSIYLQYLIELADYWFHRLVPDVVLSPVTANMWPDTANIRHIPPPIRSSLRPRPASREPRRVLVMLSGSGFASNTAFLDDLRLPPGVRVDVIGGTGTDTDVITYHGKVYRNAELLSEADVMVVNGGYSAVSEAIVLRKPVVVIPIENHAEQFINALTVESLGLGLMADQTTAPVAIARIFDEYGEFVRAHQTSLVPTDGAAVAADLIVRRVSGQTDEPEAGRPSSRATRATRATR